MARVSKIARGTISMARGIHCCPNFFLFLLSDQRRYVVKNMCIYTHIWLSRDSMWITVATK
jgi:hypothetical protein